MTSTTDDKTLLELAAKAAGIEIRGNANKWIAQGVTELDLLVWNDKGGDSVWNPLTDDGDALRLAVKLDLFWENMELFDIQMMGLLNTTEDVRRAIVRAAAEIGKTL